MAKAFVALYDDPNKAQRVVYDLYHVGVQRDHVHIITGSLSEQNLEWFEQNWIEDRKDHYQKHLENGGAMVIAWVMNVFRKDAEFVLNRHRYIEMSEVKGRRWLGFNTTKT